MGGVKSFIDLEVWKKAHELTISVYHLTTCFPSDEKFGLISQMRRASVSVPANIAEGFFRRSRRDKANFYVISHGSLEELRYYLILSRDLGYIGSNEELLKKVDSVSMMLNKLIASVLS